MKIRNHERVVFGEEHDAFRASFRRFVAEQVTPHYQDWDASGIVPRDLWKEAGRHGFLGMSVPTSFGGGGVPDYRYNAIVTEELFYAAAPGVAFPLHNDVCLPYLVSLGTEEQHQRWLPAACRGELLTAIAMTEPGAGSDLAGIRTAAEKVNDGWRLNGAKTFISNGILNDLVIVVARTSSEATTSHALTLLVVERGMDGYERGRNLDKIGMHAQDTAELFFKDVFVPKGNVLGEVGAGFSYLMQNLAQERLSIAVSALASVERALELTIEYACQRKAFGRRVIDFQNSRFVLSEVATEARIGRVYVDACIERHVRGSLTSEEAAMAKWWASDLQMRVLDRCLQLHGGYGFMREFEVGRMYQDSRIQTIYGGTNEIMKEIVGRALVGSLPR